jgi:Fe-S cluster assembly iron-binding protein IscA
MSIKVDVTKEAQSQVHALIKTQKPGMAVRVYLQPSGGGGCGCGGGGCGSGGCGSGESSSSPAFGMAFDKPRNGDEVIQVDGFNVIVDSSSAELLDGATIDFVQGLEESGFKINSPLLMAAKPSGGGGCGCGSGGGGGCC